MLILKYVIGFLMLLGFAKFVNAGGFNFRKRYLLKYGIPAVAKILTIEKTIFELGQGVRARPVMRIVLEFGISTTLNKQVTINHAFFDSNPPHIGDTVNILIDPRNSDKIILSPIYSNSF